jgi:hypothetical protein
MSLWIPLIALFLSANSLSEPRQPDSQALNIEESTKSLQAATPFTNLFQLPLKNWNNEERSLKIAINNDSNVYELILSFLYAGAHMYGHDC